MLPCVAAAFVGEFPHQSLAVNMHSIMLGGFKPFLGCQSCFFDASLMTLYYAVPTLESLERCVTKAAPSNLKFCRGWLQSFKAKTLKLGSLGESLEIWMVQAAMAAMASRGYGWPNRETNW